MILITDLTQYIYGLPFYSKHRSVQCVVGLSFADVYILRLLFQAKEAARSQPANKNELVELIHNMLCTLQVCRKVYFYSNDTSTDQMAQMVRRLPLVWEVWGSNSKPIRSPTHCQRLVTAATLICGSGAKPQRLALLTHDTRKGIRRVKWRFDLTIRQLLRISVKQCTFPRF